ncbi:sacsin N-terminal ATP-binding-like domain-containing protein [Niallia sp. Marseille-Q9988]
MIKTLIKKISNDFLNEAVHSPNLFKDMGAMEKYIAESYGERILIELLQNSDDAQSNKIKLFNTKGNLFFANNGRPFNEKDIMSICRSGASHKQRGVTIGYRGVGFKSTSYLSNDIIIYSNDTYFTFSRATCSQVLSIPEKDIPLIRIPFIIDKNELEDHIVQEVESLKNKGYQTVFIFKNAKLNYLTEEMKSLDESYFIFLNHISDVSIYLEGKKWEYQINRVSEKDFLNGKWLKIVDNEDKPLQYLVFSKHENNKKYDIAFVVDDNGYIVECDDKKAVYHCYLPTLEKTGFPFKINADFSTDPSRKHLEFDEQTKNSLNHISELLFEVLQGVVKHEKSEYALIFDMIRRKTNFTKYSVLCHQLIKEKLQSESWIPLETGELVSPKDCYKLPKWFETAEFNLIRKHSIYIRERSILTDLIDQMPELANLLNEYAEKEFALEDWVEALKDRSFIDNVENGLLAKIYVFLFKGARNAKMIKNQEIKIEDCLLKESGGKIIKFLDVNKDIILPDDFIDYIDSQISDSEKRWIEENYNVVIWEEDSAYDDELEDEEDFSDLESERTSLQSKQLQSAKSESISVNQKMTVSKWYTAEQQCVELEKNFGNRARYVGKQNLGYDVESIMPDGRKRYIEVKSLSSGDKSIKLTNNEFTAAFQLGEEYYICLIEQHEDHMTATYINNPAKNVNFEKRVVRWEWYGDKYTGEQIEMPYSKRKF